MLTQEECRKILFRIGIKLGVSPRLIETRLLNAEDKSYLRSGHMTIVELEKAVEVWRGNGMPDLAHGCFESLESENKRLKYEKSVDDGKLDKYNKPFVDYRLVD